MGSKELERTGLGLHHMPSGLEHRPSLRGLLVADEWLLACLIWLVPLLGIFAVADATFFRFGRPAALTAAQWLTFHAAIPLPGVLVLCTRIYTLWRLHSRATLVQGRVENTSKARGYGWYVVVTYSLGGHSFKKRFYVQSPAHYRRLVVTGTTSLLVDPKQPNRSFLAGTLLQPLFA